MGEKALSSDKWKAWTVTSSTILLYFAYKGLPVINTRTHPMSLSAEPWLPSASAGGAATQRGEQLCFWYFPLEFGMHFPSEKNYNK